MVVGYILGRMGFIREEFCKGADKLVFKVTLPAMMIHDMYKIDLEHDFDMKYVGYCFVVTLIMIVVIWILAKLFMRDKSIVGEFVQGSYRSSAAVLGSAFLINIYGSTGMAPLMIIGSVPLFNAMAVVILTLENPEQRSGLSGGALAHKTLVGIVTNPIILGILIGTLWNVIKLPMPVMIEKTLSSLSGLTTPLALISIGAAFEGAQAIKLLKPTIIATSLKLVVLAAIFLPIAVWLGFTDQKLVALIIMLGSPSTASGYVMAKNMGHRGVLAASCVALTTFLSAFTLTFWLWLFKALGYIGG